MNRNKFVTVIKTRKYKNINLYLRFSIENKKFAKEKVALLCKMIGDISNKYKTKSEMTKAKDMLYGINCVCSYKVRANIISLSIHYSFINPKFVDVDIREYNDYIKETLFNSIINEETLDEAKRTIKASIIRKNDKPSVYANERFIDIVSKDNKQFSIYSENERFIKDLESIKLDDIKQTYRETINRSQLNVYLCGDVDENDINILTTYDFSKRNVVNLSCKKIVGPNKRDIVEEKDISQTYLVMAYKTPFNKKSKDYFTWFIGNALLGVVPTSLLFTQIREKMSLCYAISSIDYKNEGLVKIVTSIDAKNKDITIKEITNQINRLVNNDYDVSLLDSAKSLVINSLLSIYDDLDALVDYFYESYLSDFDYSIEECCKAIMKVNQKDISKVYKKYEHYFNYVLLGTKNE